MITRPANLPQTWASILADRPSPSSWRAVAFIVTFVAFDANVRSFQTVNSTASAVPVLAFHTLFCTSSFL